jgi:hypothetical protein
MRNSIKIAGIWKENHDFGSIPPRCSHTSTMIGHCMYIVGGGVFHHVLNQFLHSKEIWKIDFVAKTQTLLKIDDFEGRRGHSATSFRDRFIIIFGGYKTVDDHDVLCTDLTIIDTVTERKLAYHDRNAQAGLNEVYVAPSPRRGHLAAMQQGNRMLVMGGDHDGDLFDGDHNYVYSLSLLTHDEYIHVNELNHHADDDEDGGDDEPEEAGAINGTFLREGVYGLWRRDEIQGRLPIKLALAACVQIGSELLIFGGSCVAIQQQSFIVSNHVNANLYVFDVDTFELTNITGHITVTVDGHSDVSSSTGAGAGAVIELAPRYCAAMAAVNDNVLVIYGGTTQLGESLSELLVLHAAATPSQQQQQQQQLLQHQPWRQRRLRCVRSYHPSFMTTQGKSSPTSSPPSPSPRNAMSLVACGRGSPSLVMFGGGVFPDEYYRDMWTLNLLSSPVGALCQDSSRSQIIQLQHAHSVDSYFQLCFEDKRHADVELILKGNDIETLNECCSSIPTSTPTTIRAHKIILAAKSSFFKSLFDGGWADNQQTISSSGSGSGSGSAGMDCDLPRISLDAKITPFRHVLQFLYTSSMNNDQVFASLESAVDVLQCATMLNLSECKAFCEEELAIRYLRLGQGTSRGTRSGEGGGGGALHLACSADELRVREQEAAYLLSIADTFHCERLSRASLEQIRACRTVLCPREDATTICVSDVDVDIVGIDASVITNSPAISDDGSAVQYSEFFDSLSPLMCARLKKSLDPSSVLFLP